MALHKQNILLVASGLGGVSFVSVITFVSIATLNRHLLVATFCFSIAIPALAASVLLARDESITKPIREDPYLLMFLAGSFLALVGIGAVFFHLNVWAGAAFIISVIITFTIIMIVRPDVS